MKFHHHIHWLPRSLRRQFQFAVTVLTLLILAGGSVAVYALRSSSQEVHRLAEERLMQMQEAQELVQRTLLIEREADLLLNADSLAEMRDIYAEASGYLAEFDELVDRLTAGREENAVLLDLHQASQLFRNTVNVAAQSRERELRSKAAGGVGSVDAESQQKYQYELRKQARNLVVVAQVQSEDFARGYRKAVLSVEKITQRNTRWVTVLLVTSLVLAWGVSQLFLGRHVLRRLQRVSHNLRDGGESEPVSTERSSVGTHDEIDEMAQAVSQFQEDRRRLGVRTEELRLARDAAEAANKAKSLFLANMSHELRTPLNAILGFSSMMRQDPELTAGQRENIDIINRSGAHLLGLINDVLEIAKIESGKLQLEVAPFDLGAMVRDVCEMMRLRAEQKGLRLELDQSSEFPRYIKGDEARLRQILVNLLGNAVKFTEEGGVTIRLGVRNNARYHLMVEVEDSGIGISRAEQEKLFQPFVQLSQGAGKGGTGLGLSIAQQFAQLMGGHIVVDSTPGKGSVFRVDLPLELASEAEVMALKKTEHGEVVGLVPGQPAWRILIAEDQYENRLLLGRLMTDIGLEVKMAEDGAQCVRLFEEWQPNLVWMDRRMPVMDGLEASRRIRKLPGGDKVKIVAVTASVFKEQQSEIMAAGIDDLVRKPYRFSEIYDCMTRQLGAQFVYGDEAPMVADRVEALTPKMLQGLPPAVRGELKEALESLDSRRIAEALRKATAVDIKLGRILASYVEYFDYPPVLSAIREAGVPDKE